MMALKEIKFGHTNKRKYVDLEKGLFVLEKTQNGFNHKLDYSVLSKFDFVPALYADKEGKMVGDYIDGVHPDTMDSKRLSQIVDGFVAIHTSDIKLPNNNISARIEFLIKRLAEQKVSEPVVSKTASEVLSIAKSIKNEMPCHLDLGKENILVDKKEKVGFVDGEYAALGEVALDLAIFSKAMRLTDEEELRLVMAYNSAAKTHIEPKRFNDFKFLSAGMTCAGALLQPALPFDISFNIAILTNKK